MAIESIAPIALDAEKVLAAPRTEAATASFGNWFAGEMTAVNDKLVRSDQQVQELAAGTTQNLHEVMINLEETRLSFQLLVQVRNRLLEAYQEVMRMQV